jgi:hypothetical protein
MKKRAGKHFNQSLAITFCCLASSTSGSLHSVPSISILKGFRGLF